MMASKNHYPMPALSRTPAAMDNCVLIPEKGRITPQIHPSSDRQSRFLPLKSRGIGSRGSLQRFLPHMIRIFNFHCIVS